MTGVAAKVTEIPRLLGRDDETELMTILPSSRLEVGEVSLIRRRPVGFAWFAVAPDTFAFDVTQVRRGRALPDLPEIHQSSLDGDAPRGAR
jgi:hypothetical protein